MITAVVAGQSSSRHWSHVIRKPIPAMTAKITSTKQIEGVELLGRVFHVAACACRQGTTRPALEQGGKKRKHNEYHKREQKQDTHSRRVSSHNDLTKS
jgi:hypothetical protein